MFAPIHDTPYLQPKRHDIGPSFLIVRHQLLGLRSGSNRQATHLRVRKAHLEIKLPPNKTPMHELAQAHIGAHTTTHVSPWTHVCDVHALCSTPARTLTRTWLARCLRALLTAPCGGRSPAEPACVPLGRVPVATPVLVHCGGPDAKRRCAFGKSPSCHTRSPAEPACVPLERVPVATPVLSSCRPPDTHTCTQAPTNTSRHADAPYRTPTHHLDVYISFLTALISHA